jgi:hypothetical protein
MAKGTATVSLPRKTRLYRSGKTRGWVVVTSVVRMGKIGPVQAGPNGVGAGPRAWGAGGSPSPLTAFRATAAPPQARHHRPTSAHLGHKGPSHLANPQAIAPLAPIVKTYVP